MNKCMTALFVFLLNYRLFAEKHVIFSAFTRFSRKKCQFSFALSIYARDELDVKKTVVLGLPDCSTKPDASHDVLTFKIKAYKRIFCKYGSGAYFKRKMYKDSLILCIAHPHTSNSMTLVVIHLHGLKASGSGWHLIFGGLFTATFPHNVITVGEGVTLGWNTPISSSNSASLSCSNVPHASFPRVALLCSTSPMNAR